MWEIEVRNRRMLRLEGERVEGRAEGVQADTVIEGRETKRGQRPFIPRENAQLRINGYGPR